jgi:hypothetical protein
MLDSPPFFGFEKKKRERKKKKFENTAIEVEKKILVSLKNSLELSKAKVIMTIAQKALRNTIAILIEVSLPPIVNEKILVLLTSSPRVLKVGNSEVWKKDIKVL